MGIVRRICGARFFSHQMIISSAVLLWISLFKPQVVYAYNECATHQACNINQACECTVPATSAFNRYFYFDFSMLEKGKHYLCSFNSTPVAFTVVFEECNFPEGVSYQCAPGCPTFPLSLSIDTSNMKDQQSTFMIKVFVPGSDYPSKFIAKCEEDNSILIPLRF